MTAGRTGAAVVHPPVMAARVPPETPNEPYDLTEQRKFLEFTRRADAHRDLEADYFREVERLVGKPVGDWLEADAELEKFVLAAGPERDDELISLFHRWAVVQARTLLPGLAHLPMFDQHWPRLSKLIA